MSAEPTDPQTPTGPFPAWVFCENCEDYLCSIHRVHVYECDCPPIEEWEVDPYAEGGAPLQVPTIP